MPVDRENAAALALAARVGEWLGGAVALSATSLGIELGLFEHLRATGAASPTALAAELKLDRRAVEVWAAALVHHGILEPEGVGAVALAPGAGALLFDRSSPVHLAPSIEFYGQFLARDFAELGAFFRDGRPRPSARHGQPLARNVAAQTASMHALFIQAILPRLPEIEALLVSGGAVLDIGCGTGNLGVLLCERFPAMHYLGIDRDPLPVAEGAAAPESLLAGGRLRIEVGEATAIGPASADLVVLFLALHEVPLAERPAVMGVARAALRPGGLLLVFDPVFPATLEEAIEPRARTAIHFAYEELLWGSSVPTRRELDTLLLAAGFTGIEHRPMLDGAIEVVLAR